MDRPVAQSGLSSFRFVLRNLLTRRKQSLLAILGIAVALGAGITSIGFSESVTRGLATGYLFNSIDLVVLQADKPNPVTSRLSTEALPKLEVLPGVERVLVLMVDFLTLNETQNILVYGMPADYPEVQKRVEGRPMPLGRNELLVGKGVAALGDLNPGDRIDLNLGSFTVAGLFDTGNFMENGIVYMRLDDLQRLTGTRDRVNFIMLDLADPMAASALAGIKQRVERIVPGSKVLTADEFIGEDESLRVMRGLSRIILVTSTLLAVLLVSTIMVLTVSERRRELAILRAIGWSPLRIGGLILTETLTLAAIGAVSGMLLGWLGMDAALRSLQPLGIYAESVVTLPLLALAALAMAAVAVLGAGIPVYQALRIRVSEAVKYE